MLLSLDFCKVLSSSPNRLKCFRAFPGLPVFHAEKRKRQAIPVQGISIVLSVVREISSHEEKKILLSDYIYLFGNDTVCLICVSLLWTIIILAYGLYCTLDRHYCIIRGSLPNGLLALEVLYIVFQ